MIRVLIVEDSPTAVRLITDILKSDPEIAVVGTAVTGEEAVRLVGKLKPDLITMDIRLPGMDGIEATKQIMAYAPTPILILSSVVFQNGREYLFKALSYGALDAMEKPCVVDGNVPDEVRDELVDKVKLLARIKVLPHLLAKIENRPAHPLIPCHSLGQKIGVSKVIGLVASTGGPQALARILSEIPADFPIPISIVQHISPGFGAGFVSWLSGETSLAIKLGEDGEILTPSTAYVAPPGRQMRILPGGEVKLSDEGVLHGHCPSGTVLLESIARSYGKNGMGVILSGMGRDGATGLNDIFDAGGMTIAQDKESSMIYGMPKAALESGAVRIVMPVSDIAGRILAWARGT
jgi:two-component system chemotaxis response regulator CheB